MSDRPTCVINGCTEPGEWHVLRVSEWSPVHGPIHSGRFFAPYRVNTIAQYDKCLAHAKEEAEARNAEVRA